MRFPQAFSMTSNYGFNHVNAGAERGNTTPDIDLSNFNLGRSGLDLNKRMVEIRRSYVNPKRVEIKSRIDYLPEPNQTTLSLTEEIRVTEIIRTQEIVRTKFIQSSFPNDVTLRLNERLGRPAFEDQINDPNPFTQQNDTRLQLYNPDHNSRHFDLNIDQTNELIGSSDRNPLCYHNNDQHEPSGRQVDQVLDLDPISVYFDETPEEKLRNSTQEFNYLNLTLRQPKPEPGFANHLNSDRNLLCYHNNDQHEPSGGQVDQVLDLDPISVYFDETPEEKLRNSTQEFNYLNLTLRQPKPETEPEPGFANHLNSFPRITSLDEDDEEDKNENNYEVGDGRTRSLPHQKYGPYTCPRCRGVFVTSQIFAAHMASHYKLESKNEKTRRRAAKNKSRNIHLLHTKYGLTVLPKSFKPSEAKKSGGKVPFGYRMKEAVLKRRKQESSEKMEVFVWTVCLASVLNCSFLELQWCFDYHLSYNLFFSGVIVLCLLFVFFCCCCYGLFPELKRRRRKWRRSSVVSVKLQHA